MSKLANMEVTSIYQESFAFFGMENTQTDQLAQDISTSSLNLRKTSQRPFRVDELPSGELTEIVCNDAMDSLHSLLPSLARLSEEDRWITLIAPPSNLDNKLFALYGIDLNRVLLIHPKDLAQNTLLMNNALKTGKSGIVICWSNLVTSRFFAQWRKSVKQGSCIGVWVNLSGVASSSKSIALTANVDVTDRYIRLKKTKEFGVDDLGNSEIVLPKLNLDNLLGLKQRYTKSAFRVLN